jgi:hypothetical protein
VILETALADALYLNWAIPLAALPAAPSGLRYDTAVREGESFGYFSLVLFRQTGIHLRGASWLALSYPQINARLYVRDGANTASVLLLRQLAPGWVVPIGRFVGGQPLSAAVCEFPDGLPRGGEEGSDTPAEEAREWRWSFSAGARLVVTAQVAAPAPASTGEVAAEAAGGDSFRADAAFFRERTRSYWRHGGQGRPDGLRRVETEQPAANILPVRARFERTDWLETFFDFRPRQGWANVESAFLVPRVQLVYAFDAARELAPTAPMAAAG